MGLCCRIHALSLNLGAVGQQMGSMAGQGMGNPVLHADPSGNQASRLRPKFALM